MKKIPLSNPWIGLQTYVEGDVLYGRDEDIRNLSQYILTDSETVLYGKSGIGKSSVLNAGVIPRARMNGITPIVIRLAHGEDAEPYITQIKNRIQNTGILIDGAGELASSSFWELIHKERFINSTGESAKLLIIFDQFEEIFTLQQNSQLKKKFFQELADVINDIKPSSLNNEKNNEIKIEDDNSIDVSLDDMDFELPDSSNEYYFDNEIHIVFTLREDFLSEFEYYTANIPSLKQHRYGLRPINEEQAAEIIQSPYQGLVSQDVAKLIIEKVTKCSDFTLDGIPAIEVDAAVLSLYLSKLFDKSDKQCITKELVEKEAGNIIREFYEECIAGIPLDIIDKLEAVLVNKEGHRENKSLNVLSEEIGIKGCIENLVQKKILRTFNYAGEEKVELIHDVLCDVVKARKVEKEKLEKEKKEKLALTRQNRKNKIRLYIVSAVLVIALGTILWLLMRNQQLQNEEGYGMQQEFSIKLSEDSLVVVDNEFWNAHLLVVAYGDSITEIIYDIDINKAFRDSTFRFTVDSIKSFYVSLDFETSNNRKYYNNIVYNDIPIGYFTNNKELKLNIRYDDSRMIKYEGQINADINGELINLQDAIVILRDNVRHTDANGHFSFLLEDSLKIDESIFFFCKGFNSIEDSLYVDGVLRHDFNIEPVDSITSYMLMCQKADSMNYYYNSRVVVTYIDGATDSIIFHANAESKIPQHTNKVSVKGYYYYLNDYNKYKKEERYLAYHLFTGWMDSNWSNKENSETQIKESVKEIEFIGYDKVHNKQTFTGVRKHRDGNFYGEIYDLSGKIGDFGIFRKNINNNIDHRHN